MDIKHYIIKAACDADARPRYLKHAPHLFDDYFVIKSGGEVVTSQEWDKLHAFHYFLDGLDFVSAAVLA
ncbi:hypothetical protein A3I35_03010 [Candidatus Falkowbacteria bacterium RIFCSPLOWO2_02_FULL_45_15]|uniref:Uncharacterized protein n=2 Tax=Candidatus Falkowiibacteriota TaxID=1752728 RepID=A0A1F5RZ86_9BACT|nr:MAG: hypothetical protein A3I35_03010 [Candidatus Falkowbacteria bacterium RIFCSPLOWO2_02_FULL_45_15]OGF19738.1 MAG: hypothetical protein A3D54_02430 [Candidatus Falkowbacteria bacterium RIFCSPHIGHO2_02_FULL_45_15]